jgi:hypothetical protein
MVSDTEKEFEETVKRLLKMPAKTRGKDASEKENDGPAKQGRQDPKD